MVNVFGKANRKSLIIISITLLFVSIFVTGCTVNIKEGELVVIEEKQNPESKLSQGYIDNQFDTAAQKKIIDKNRDIISKLKTELNPIAVSSDHNYIFAYETVINPEVDKINSRVITGNISQEIMLYVINASTNEKKQLGVFLSLKDFQFDDTGNLFAFVDGNSNVYVYDLNTGILDTLYEGSKYISHHQISWSKNSNRIMIDTKLNFDIATKKLISYVNVDTPYIKSKLDNTDYIVQMKNADFADMVAIYNFSTGEYASLAKGIYLDSDNKFIIYSNEEMSMLSMVDLKTNESKFIEEGPIYSACIIKSTGKIIYTTLNEDVDNSQRYILYEYNPANGDRKRLMVSSPTFYLSPAEDKLFFIAHYGENSLSVDLASFVVTSSGYLHDSNDLAKIKATILKMFHLDYSFNRGYEAYVDQAKKIYTNTYDPLPQEAYTNKLIDFKRFNTPLPGIQKEASIPHTLVINSLNIKNDTASVNVGLFYVNAIEMVKIEDNWLITGFSTHPDSKEVKDVSTKVQEHLDEIKNKNREVALSHWDISADSEIIQTQVKIVEDLIAKSESYIYEIGEIELWNISEPHRVERPESATHARVKIIIKSDTDTIKFKLILTRLQRNEFEVDSWSTDPLSISQLF